MAKLTTMTTYKTRIGNEGARLQLDYNHETGVVWLEASVSCDPEDPSVLAELDDTKLSDLIDALTQFRELKASEKERAQQGKVFGDVTLMPPKPLTFADLGEGDIGCRFRILKGGDEFDSYYEDCVVSLESLPEGAEVERYAYTEIISGKDEGACSSCHRDTQIERIV